MTRALLLSIKPRYVERILAGTKTVELRRVRPRVERGEPVLIYSSSPRMALVATATVGDVTTAAPSTIWRRLREQVGTTRGEFDAYFAGAARATAMGLEGVTPLAEEVELAELRRRWLGFRPPQSYCFLAVRAARTERGDARRADSSCL